jgi:cell division protein FtsN
MTRHEHHQEAQRSAREPSRVLVGSTLGVLIVLFLTLIGVSRQPEEPLPLSAATAGAPSVRPPADAEPPAYPPPTSDEPPGEPPPSF